MMRRERQSNRFSARSVVGISLIAIVASCAEAPELVREPSESPETLVLRDVGVADVVAGRTLEHRDVVVRAGKIVELVQHDPGDPRGGARVIEGAGRTVVPGYVDMHAHVGGNSAPSWVSRFPNPDANMRGYLYCGITTILDPAGMSNETFARRDDVAAGDLLGPRQFCAGPVVTAVGGHPVPILEHLAPWWLRWYLLPRFAKEVDSLESARAAVREIAGYGTDFVKLAIDRIPEGVPRITPELAAAVVDEASTHGLRVVAHIGTAEDAVDAAEAGVAAWVHGVYKERLSDEDVARLAGYGIPMVATMVVFESYAMLLSPPRRPTQLEVETVPPEVLGAFDEIPEGEASIEFFRDYLESMVPLRSAWRDNVRRLHEAGVTILAGSDNQIAVFPGAGLHREFALLAESGLEPAEILRATTLYPARFLEETDDPSFGILAEGKRADLVLIDGDPFTDSAALSQIALVVRGGVPLERIPVRSASGD